MRKSFTLFLSIILLTGMLGCGGGEAETADSESSSGRSGVSNLSSVGDDPSTANNADANARTPNNPVGEGESNAGAETGSATTQVSFNNGLFPQMTTVAASGFGGALFPNMQPDGNAGSMSKIADDDMPAGAPDLDPFDLGDSGADSDFEPNSAAVVSVPEPESVAISLLPDAKRLFQEHREQDAINVLYANHLVSDASSKDYLLNWYSGLKEPRLFFRWGVGVIYNQPRDFEGRHPVIGDPGDENEGGGGRSGNSGRGNRRGGIGIGGVGAGGGGSAASGARNYKNIDTSRPDGVLMYYTGDFGKQLISFMEARLNDDQAPYYGLILREVMKVEIPEDDKNNAATQRPSNRPPSGRGGRPPGAIGALGAIGGEGGGGGRGGGRGGNSAPAQPIVDTNTSIIDRATGSSIAAKPDDEFTGSILPGVMLLGVGSKANLIERAQSSDVDALIVFNVKVSKSRSSRSSTGRRGSGSRPPSRTNTTSMKIINIGSEKAENLFSSKALKAATVLDDNNEGEDPVKEEIEKAFDKVADKLFKASDMPSGLTMDNVKKRVGRIANTKAEFPLPVAVEIVSFYRKDLLAEDIAITALKRVFGTDDAAILIQGSPRERMEFVKSWIPDDTGE